MQLSQRENITPRQITFMMILFFFGSSVVFGVNTNSGQDSWISLLLGIAISVPVLLVYARIIKLYPNRDFFQLLTDLFGKAGGGILTALFSWYCLLLASAVLRIFSEFIQIVSLPETPELALTIAFILLTAYMVKSGLQVMGEWSIVTLAIMLSIILFTVLGSLNHLDPTNLLPVLEHPPGEILESAYQIFSFPLAESVVFLPLLPYAKKASPYRFYLGGLLFGGGGLLLIVLRNILCVGPALMQAEYFPSYVCARVMEVGSFLSRVEGGISINFVLSGMTKITVCMYAGTLGFTRLFHVRSMEYTVMPVCLIVLLLSKIVYSGSMQMQDFIRLYPYLAFPFQIALPLLIWLFAERKSRGQKPGATPSPQAG
jgi:spore germination protein KB